MLIETEGDILLSKATALAHGVAVDDDFKQGLALKLREQWPSLYKDFRHYCQTSSPNEGSVWSWKGAGGPAILNLFTQAPPPQKGGHPGKASLSNVNHALKNLATTLQTEGYKSVALTRLATGVGGLEWKDVKPLVEKHLGALPIKVYVYTKFVKDQAGEK